MFIDDEVMMQHQDEIYYCISTNDNNLTPAEIIKLHRQRGETSENKIKELKNGFNMSYLPSSNLEANAFKTIRYKLYNIAGKVIFHARETILKVNEEYIKLLQRIRQKAYKESLQ